MSTHNKKHRVILLDAHAILHRAYHALPDFSSSSGEPTGALYGLSTMLMKTITELEPDEIIAAYDLPEPTYRHEMFEEYKAGRPEIDEALVSQLQQSREIFSAFSVPYYEAAGFEADDILGTIVAKLADKKDVEIIIASGDLDTLQLVSGKRVRVYTMRKGIKETVIYDEAAVKERFGFAPKYLPDYKGLRGDPSDNIPGIPGIGEKTASKLIATFKTIETIFKKQEKDPGLLTEEGISKRIVNLLEEHKEDAHFSKMLATIRSDAPIDFTLPETPWCKRVEMQEILDAFEKLGFRSLVQRAKTLFTDESEEKTAEKEEAEPDETELAETAVALWLIDSTITNPTREDILQFTRANSFKEAREHIFERLESDGLMHVFKTIEQPLIPIVARMQERGIVIDENCLSKLSREYHKELTKIEKRIFEHAGREFNVGSPKQLAEVLFDELGIGGNRGKRTATGRRSTRESELAKLKDKHPIIEDILSFRELQKLLSTYIDAIPKLVGEDGRLHARFLQAGTTTGRMASANPNLQNIPIRTELGRQVRDAFVASEGFTLAAFDYSQIELRIAAFLSGDEKLIAVFKNGGDIHEAVAAEVFEVDKADVDSEMRRKAKVINFGILYGMGVSALQQSLDTDRAHAQEFLNAYFERFPGLAKHISEVKAEAAKQGYTETYFGRRRYIEGITSSIPYIRAGAERMAINAPIQGTQADIIKLAMVRIDEKLRKHKKHEDVYLLLQVHDELIYEIRTDVWDEVAPMINETMESVLTEKETNGVPIDVDASCGPRWGALERVTINEGK